MIRLKKKKDRKITLRFLIDFRHLVTGKRLIVDIFIDLSANSGHSTAAATLSRCIKFNALASLWSLHQKAYSFLLINVKKDER